MKVRDAMTKDPLTIGADASLPMAEAVMRDRGVQHLPVVSAAGLLLGIVTDRDVEHAAFMPALVGTLAWEPRWLRAPRVRDVMTWSPVTTHPHTALSQAALTMFQHRIGSLPVVEDGRLVGILTGRDVLAAFGSTREAETDALIQG
jgi:acetoin utilization protein AcuB